MVFVVKCQFRGFNTKIGKNGSSYQYINIEDEFGEGLKLSARDVDLSTLKKGDLINAEIEYSPIYKSLSFVGFRKQV